MDEAKFARWGLLGGVGFVVLVVVAALIGGSPPKLTDNDTEIVKYFQDNQDALRIGSYLSGFGSVLFLWFLGSLFGRLRRAEGGAGRLAGVALTAAVVAVTVSFVANGIGAYTALHPEGAGGGYRLASVLFGYTGFAIAVFTAAVSVLVWSQNVLPKWFGYAGEALALAWFVAAAGVSSESDTIFTIGFIVFLVWAVWLAALSELLYRTPETA
jgi:hypothetical protein